MRVARNTLHVTRDQEEALALAHRVTVLEDGACHQIGTPNVSLDHPATAFVSTVLARQRDA